MDGIRGELTRLTEAIHTLLVSHAIIATKVDALGATLAEIHPEVQKIPDLNRRVTLLERIVLGCCGVILLAVVGLWLQSVGLAQRLGVP